VRGPSDVPRMTSDRPPRGEGYRGAAVSAPKAEVNGNSVEYWEKREREAKAKAAAARSSGARAGQPRSYGNENRGGGNRVGVRGRFKDWPSENQAIRLERKGVSRETPFLRPRVAGYLSRTIATIAP